MLYMYVWCSSDHRLLRIRKRKCLYSSLAAVTFTTYKARLSFSHVCGAHIQLVPIAKQTKKLSVILYFYLINFKRKVLIILSIEQNLINK